MLPLGKTVYTHTPGFSVFKYIFFSNCLFHSKGVERTSYHELLYNALQSLRDREFSTFYESLKHARYCKKKKLLYFNIASFLKTWRIISVQRFAVVKGEDLIALVRLFFVIPFTPLKKIPCVIHNSYQSVLKLRISKVGGNTQQLTIS